VITPTSKSAAAVTGPYQLFPGLSAEEFAALKADIAARGVLVPIEFDETGAVLDGHHRLRAWAELRAEGVRVAPYPRVVRQLAGEQEKKAHAVALNLARRHLEPAERRELVSRLRAEGWSLRRIAGTLGVRRRFLGADIDPAAVTMARSRLEAGK